MKFYARKKGHTYVYGVGDAPGTAIIAHPNLVPTIETAAQPVFMCSRNHIDPERVDDVAYVKSRMDMTDPEPKCGGWRLLDKHEVNALYFSHQTLACMEDHPGVLCDGMETGTKYHPAWQAGLGFAVYNKPCVHIAQVLAAIYDVRRFAVGQSTRNSAIRSWFRVAGAKLFAGKTHHVLTPVDRPFSLLSAWLLQFEGKSVEELYGIPQAWMQRELVFYTNKYLKQHSEKRAYNMGTWRATQRFLDFIRLTWLHSLGDVRFEPAQFFRRKDEVQAFMEYITARDISA